MDAKINEPRLADVLSAGNVEDALMTVLENGINPASTEALMMKVLVYMRQRKMDEAGRVLHQLIRLGPNIRLYKVLGDWHFLMNNFDKAEKAYKKALDIQPLPDIVHDYGVAINSQGKVSESLPYMRKAFEMAPDNHSFGHHLAIIELLAGEELQGWARMEERLKCPGVTGEFPNPEKYWKGENLKGKTIVVRTEQGFGDTIQFARYLPLLQAQNPKKIYVFCQQSMIGFIDKFFPFVETWPNYACPPLDFDYHVNVMCFPRLFPNEYLTVPSRKERGEGVGICWFGSPSHKADHLRTIQLEKWNTIFMDEDLQDIPWKCAAYGRFDQKPPFIDYIIDRCKDWAETAEKIKCLDLVVTVDTAIAHLAGFLGVPVWLMLAKVPDFRWGMEGETTHWYESIRLYRQEKVLDWEPVLERIKEDLKERYKKA